MNKGFDGVILRINLAEKTVEREGINEDWAKLFIGGRGYGEKIIYEEVDPTIDPLSEHNKVIIATGPLVGTMAPAAGRTMVITKGALNNTIACSNAGGYFGTELKMAGYDMIIFEGKAHEPVYLWIDNDSVEIRDAQDIWGKTTLDSDTVLRKLVLQGKNCQR